MVDYLLENQGVCVAFPGGRGTTDMITRCQNAGVPVVFIKQGEVYWPNE
jgi:hypothetical protein